MLLDRRDQIGGKEQIVVLFQSELTVYSLFEGVRTIIVELLGKNDVQSRFSRITSHLMLFLRKYRKNPLPNRKGFCA